MGCGPAEQRLLLTGLHSVADIFCQSCKTTLGWKYVSAPTHGTPTLGTPALLQAPLGHLVPSLWTLSQSPTLTSAMYTTRGTLKSLVLAPNPCHGHHPGHPKPPL